jgi:hypothetical protein
MVLMPLLLVCLIQDGCLRCDHEGIVACKEHDAAWHAMEAGVEFCSVAAACPECGGTMSVDCKHCKSGPESRPNEERRRVIQGKLRATSIEEQVGRSLPRVETAHHQLVVDTRVMRDGRKKVDPHTLIHLVADDCEAVAALIAEHYDVRERDYRTKMRMWIFQEREDHITAMQRFLKSGAGGDFKMLGRSPVFSVAVDPPLFDTVPEVRSLFAHNSAHMLISNLYKSHWFGDTGGGWLDAGAGHWYEYAVFDETQNYCIEEATATETYANGKWRAAVRRRLQKEKEPFLPELIRLPTGAMTQPQQALCWSFYDYLVAEHPEALRGTLEDLKVKKEVRGIFQERLGMNVLAADKAWRDWVTGMYPTRGDEPREAEKKTR